MISWLRVTNNKIKDHSFSLSFKKKLESQKLHTSNVSNFNICCFSVSYETCAWIPSGSGLDCWLDRQHFSFPFYLHYWLIFWLSLVAALIASLLGFCPPVFMAQSLCIMVKIRKVINSSTESHMYYLYDLQGGEKRNKKNCENVQKAAWWHRFNAGKSSKENVFFFDSINCVEPLYVTAIISENRKGELEQIWSLAAYIFGWLTVTFGKCAQKETDVLVWTSRDPSPCGNIFTRGVWPVLFR